MPEFGDGGKPLWQIPELIDGRPDGRFSDIVGVKIVEIMIS